MKLAALLEAVDRIAPFELAEPWDSVGLQVGDREIDVRSLMVALDPTVTALDHAARRDCQALLVHHPLVRDPVEAVTADGFPGSLILRAASKGIAIIAAHTNVDKAHGGLADIVCQALNLEGVRPLAPARMDWFKLVGFVPESDLDAVRTAIFAVGAGTIGDYIHCSFTIPGEGTFQPGERAHPSIGEVGVEQTTGELRLEAVFPRVLRRSVTDAFVAAHSYEEPAFDVYPVEDEVRSLGLGRIGYLGGPRTLEDLAGEVAGLFGMPAIRFTGDGARVVEGIAVLPGSGASLIDDAAAAPVDVLVTGDIKYHDADRADRLGLALIDVPHEIAEGYAMQHWSEQLAEALRHDGVKVTFLEQPRRLWRRLALTPAIEEAVNGLARGHNHTDDHTLLYVDGGSRGNPGPAAIGGRLVSAGGELQEEFSDTIGTATNNVAEYQALIAGLELAL
ncbi:MAG TPA: Nif3-like dinuclear metal center hexameric protein, partial [Candidatus Methylomirabilis sp.]|nr:Nif3-like dinuclear metal center hexameric protein [Candidatus Methylomirabilis sp.]